MAPLDYPGRAGRRGVRLIDSLLVRVYGVREFTDDAECILRVSQEPAILSAPLTLGDGTVLEPGQMVVEIHFWNEHLPVIEKNGADLLWAMHFRTRLIRSLRLLADYVVDDSRFAGFAAVHGQLGFLQKREVEALKEPFARLGMLLELHSAAGLRFWRGGFWAALYSWWLMWTFNPRTLRDKRLRDVATCDLWMTRDALLSRYGMHGADVLLGTDSTRAPGIPQGGDHEAERA